MLDTSWSDKTAPLGTDVNIESFDTVLGSKGELPRQHKKSGRSPMDIICFTECWVGLVFCSGGLPIVGTRDTWAKQRFLYPRFSCNCRNASTKGMLSISPKVPPSSTMHTSGADSLLLTFSLEDLEKRDTGCFATLRIHSWMASETCGTTCTVLPRYSPIRSLSITDWYIFPVLRLLSFVKLGRVGRCVCLGWELST